MKTDPWKSFAYYSYDPSVGKILLAFVLALIGLGIWHWELEDDILGHDPTASSIGAEGLDEVHPSTD